MNHYKVRITIDTHYEKLLDNIHHYVYVKHLADEEVNRDHYHYYIKTDLKQQALQKRVKSHPLYGTIDEYGKERKGNSFYAINKVTVTEGYEYPLEYLRYLQKPNHEEKWNLPDVTEIRNNIKKYYDKIKDEKRTNKKENIVDTIKREKFNDLIENWGHYYISEDKILDLPEVVNRVIEYYKENKKLIRETVLQSQIQTIALELVPEYQRHLQNKLLIRLTM